MTKEDFIKFIEDKNKEAILHFLYEIRSNKEKTKEYFSELVTLLYNSTDKDILGQVDWLMFIYLNKNSTEEDFLKIINHEKYSYEKIQEFSHVYKSIFENNLIASKLYKYFILQNAKKYLNELRQLITCKIDINVIDLTIDEKLNIFYKTMGIIGADVLRNMTICFELLLDDSLIYKDETLLMKFARWFGWNWIATSGKFISYCKPKTDSQKKLIEILTAYIQGVGKENDKQKLSNDFVIDNEIIRARRRVEKERNDEISKRAENLSVWRKLFPRIHILKGSKVSIITEKGTKIIINKPMPMNEFAFEYELPLDLSMNPIEFDETLNYFLEGGKYEANY